MTPATQILLFGKPFRIADYFRMGQIGWHWQFDDPNLLYRRRNLFTETEFRNGTADAPTRTGSISATTLTGYAGALAFGWDGVTSAAAYKTNVTTVVGSVYFISAVVKMDDGNAPAFGSATPSAASNDFAFTLANALVAPNSYVVTDLGGGVYRVSATATAALASINNGIVKYTTNSSRTFKATAYQIEQASALSAYQPVTTWPQAYLDAVGAERIFAWTDTTGTTPVTAIGDGIGLLLGREYGGARGPEMLSNRSFASGSTGWVVTAPGVNTITISGGSARFQTTGSADAATLSQGVLLAAGKVFEVGFDVLAGSSGFLKIVPLGGATGEIQFSCTPGRKTFVSPVNTTNSFVISRVVTQAADAYLTNFSIREIPGTHLTQATGTAKPTLSARVNLLLNSEDFSSASWTKVGGVSATATKISATATGSRTFLEAYQLLVKAANSISYKASVEVKETELRYCGVAVQTAGATNGVFTQTDTRDGSQIGQGAFGSGFTLTSVTRTLLSDGYVRIEVVATTGTETGVVMAVQPSKNSTFTSTSYTAGDGMLVRKADLRTADDASKAIPAYQRVGATATDYDTDGFPHYAEGDGTDNCWASVATVDGSATDKLTVVAAVTKNSDAAAGIVLEHTASTAANNGSFLVLGSGIYGGGDRLTYAAETRGTVASNYRELRPFTAPHTGVVAFAMDNGGASAAAQLTGTVNGATPTTNVGTATTAGNFANATMYVLSRAGSSIRFNGRFYGSTGRFGPMGDSERNNLTRWWQKRIGTA